VKRQLLLVLASCSVFFGAPNVRADDSGKSIEPSIVTKKSWYGWQTLSCDSLVLTSFIIGGETAREGTLQEPYPNYFWMNRPFALSGAAIFLVGGPLVHLAHGHPLRALGDFAMRALMPGVPLLAAVALSHSSSATSNASALLLLPVAVLSGAGVVAIDATRMSREEKRVVFEEHASRSVVILPDFSVQRGGGTLGLHGSF
jgi:hypothetical protein